MFSVQKRKFISVLKYLAFKAILHPVFFAIAVNCHAILCYFKLNVVHLLTFCCCCCCCWCFDAATAKIIGMIKSLNIFRRLTCIAMRPRFFMHILAVVLATVAVVKTVVGVDADVDVVTILKIKVKNLRIKSSNWPY